MKREEDDFAAWRRQQENRATPSSYVYPQMPPRFRWCRRFAQTLFVVELGAFFVLCFMGLIAVPIVLIQGEARFLDSWIFPLMEPLLFTFLPLGFLCRWLRHTAKPLWHCPCCGQPFPYYAPDGRHEEMREKECYYTLWQMRIGYVKTKLCPLVIPSECPSCRRKFFDIEDGVTGNE